MTYFQSQWLSHCLHFVRRLLSFQQSYVLLPEAAWSPCVKQRVFSGCNKGLHYTKKIKQKERVHNEWEKNEWCSGGGKKHCSECFHVERRTKMSFYSRHRTCLETKGSLVCLPEINDKQYLLHGIPPKALWFGTFIELCFFSKELHTKAWTKYDIESLCCKDNDQNWCLTSWAIQLKKKKKILFFLFLKFVPVLPWCFCTITPSPLHSSGDTCVCFSLPLFFVLTEWVILIITQL